jgi:DNA polymerase elongation subunit (family B)
MRGWLLDIYPDYQTNTMVYWVRTRRGAERVVDRSFLPKIYAHSSPDKMDDLEGALPVLDAVKSVKREMKRTWLGEKEREVLAITVRDYDKVEDVAHTIDNRGKYKDYSLFNVDLRFSQRYFVEKDLFPMGLLEFRPKPRMLDDPYEIDYEQPPLTSAVLSIRTEAVKGVPRFEDRLLSAKVDEDIIDGPEEDIVRGIEGELRRRDPDVIYTDDGDAFSIPYLFKKARQLRLPPLSLGREEDDQRTDRRGKSYFTYGQIKYKPPSYKLKGRIHIDRSSSFMFMESGLNGLIDLSRISSVPVQELSRLSPGSAISAMEVNQALRDGCVVMWKKNLPEKFKTAEELVIADRGGFIYEPVVGIHDRVLEVDFTSLYPNIMVRFNISPETVMCSCCPEPSRRVPVIGYRICDRQLGLIPRVLKPVVERRTKLKRLAKAGGENAQVYKERVSILKWLLVTCFGYTGYKNARFGRIECHEAINAYGREIMLQASEIAESHGFEILHGIIDSLWLKGNGDPEAFCEHVSGHIGIPLEPEGIYDWIVFLPGRTYGIGVLNRYYGKFEDGKLKLRGIELRKNDTTGLVRDMQNDMLAHFSKASDSQQFIGLIPSSLDIVDGYVEDVRSGTVPLSKLLMTKRVSQGLENYQQFNDSVAALMQLDGEGFEVNPGEAVRFLICDCKSKDPKRRVKVAPFMTGDEEYDAEAYVDLLLRGAEGLLLPFGYDLRHFSALFGSKSPRN